MTDPYLCLISTSCSHCGEGAERRERGKKGKEKKRNQRQELQMMVGIIRKPTHKRDRLDRPAVGALHPGKCFCTRRHATRSGAVPEECKNKRNQRQQNPCEGRE
jgi:hypothetical protein